MEEAKIDGVPDCITNVVTTIGLAGALDAGHLQRPDQL